MKSTMKQVENLVNKYHKLKPLHKTILEIKAILYKVYGKTDFVQCLIKSKLRTSDGKKLYAPHLNPILDELYDKKLLDNQFNCNPLILHRVAILAFSQKNPDSHSNQQIAKALADYQDSPDFSGTPVYAQDHLRAVHIAVYTNDNTAFMPSNEYDEEFYLNILESFSQLFYDNSLEMDWVKTLTPEIQAYLCCSKLAAYFLTIHQLPPDFDDWLIFYKTHDFSSAPSYIQYLLLQIDIHLGLLETVEDKLKKLPDGLPYKHATEGTLLFLRQQFKAASVHYEIAIKGFKRLYEKRNWFLEDMHGVFYLFILLGEQNNPIAALNAVKIVLKHSKHDEMAFQLMKVLASLQYGQVNVANQLLEDVVNESIQSHCEDEISFLASALQSLIRYWVKLNGPKVVINAHEKSFKRLKNNFPLLAQMYAEVIHIYKDTHQKTNHFLDHSPFKPFRFLNLLTVKQPWERTIDNLSALISNKPNATHENSKLAQARRLAWFLDPKSLTIEVVEQKLGKSNTWSKGRAIALKRLYQRDPTLDYLSEQDHKALRGLTQENGGWYGQIYYNWNKQKVLPALIGHSVIFHKANPGVPLELVKGDLELYIEEQETGYTFSLSHKADVASVLLDQMSPNQYRVIELNQASVEISQLIPTDGLQVPFAAKAQVLDMIHHVKSGIHINSNLEDIALPTVASNPDCCLQLLPVQEGLRVSLWARPFEEQGPYYQPGQGKAHIIAPIMTESGEIRTKANRDLVKEQENAQHFIKNCPTLQRNDNQTSEWYLEDTEDCLELLSELENYGKQRPLRMEWPQGQTLALKKTLSFDNLKLSISSKQQWFEYDGEVQLDDNQVLSMQSLLDLLKDSPGRFVEIAKGQFVALTEKFKKQLEDLASTSDGNKVYHLGASSLRELASEIGDLEHDAGWGEHIKKIKSMAKHSPMLPSTLQAELRDYQHEGYHWLSRFSHWGIGTCLADDMGLGKTVQAIALLLEQAPQGPSLVIAPTSVGFNWVEEFSKFSPSLNVHRLQIKDRDTLIANLGKRDVLVCSYGLLLQIGDLLIDKPWQVIVLDEAQAVKNPTTKRWQVVTQLNGVCRIALTGTPIENHLGELWSIFHFLNPGLLGNLKYFQQKFAGPIEKDKNVVAKRALKKLVQPYLLRRIKSDVLDELPPKTEQTIVVEPTDEESSFYEALRVKALENISHATQANDNGQSQRFRILAEITRLRQACCDATLVEKNIGIASSKTKTCLTMIKNVLDNHHKVLIFSQYVRYLQIIKTALVNEKITLQYLDGKTPVKQRQKAVNAFQSGEGDVFLLSLKAGGTGLNLTAADYVMHLDPWWNPAVEDQASDRAHRIGQERPVTVYRLVMKNTIEEKIIQLHQDKRNLASDLLSGSDMSGKMSEEDLVKLLEI